MSVVERAINRLQKRGANTSVRGQKPVARVAGGSTRQMPLGLTAGAGIVGKGRHIEFGVEALTEAGLLSTGNSQIADEFRMIRRPIFRKVLEQSDTDLRNNLVMVTSALAGEGKTFVSVNLSLSMASEKDWQVLLVDVDCKNPQLSRLLGVGKEPGLIDILRDDEPLESVVLPTSIDRLSVLPLGSRDDNAAEYLSSSKMVELCDAMSKSSKNQIVIFDSSPALLTAEAPILSSHVGQIVAVVAAQRTPRQAVIDAIEKLDSDRAIGLVLNRVDRKGEAIGYGLYNYGYPVEE